MKCIECGTHSKLRERADGLCPKCGHRFAFEPTADRGGFTDAQFQNAIDRLSSDGKVRFTERNLWYELHRRWAFSGVFPRQAYSLAGPALLGALPGLVLGYGLSIPALYWLVPAGALGMAARSAYQTRESNQRPVTPQYAPHTPFETFRTRHLPRWVEVNGSIRGLLPPREQAAAGMPRTVPADVAAFSFDRALVTDRWETAQMLVANRFHFEHNCAVLSADGYPDGIADTIRNMLRRNPRLTVFALHDATAAGCNLPLVLRRAEWFPDPEVRIVDLGLRPEMAKRLRLPELQVPALYRPPAPEKMLSLDERKWLAAGHASELAALRPTQVMRAAYRGIVAAERGGGSSGGAEGGGGGGDTYYGGVIWVSDGPAGVDTTRVDGFG